MRIEEWAEAWGKEHEVAYFSTVVDWSLLYFFGQLPGTTLKPEHLNTLTPRTHQHE